MKDQAARKADEAKLDEAYDKLEEHAPDRVARAIRWLRDPKGKWVRIPLGVVFILLNLAGPWCPYSASNSFPSASC